MKFRSFATLTPKAVCCAPLACLLASSLSAQQAQDSRSTRDSRAGTVVQTVVYPGIPVAPADTGRMTLGWQEFSRYGWMGEDQMCASATEQAMGRVWRHGEHDTAAYRRQAEDSIPPAVRLIAERCGRSALADAARRVAAGEGGDPLFFALLQLALTLGDKTTARGVIRARLALASSPQEQTVLMRSVLTAELGTYPLWTDLLDAYAALTDSLAERPGASVSMRVNNVEAHQTLWVHWLRMGDTARTRAAVEAYLVAYRKLPVGQRGHLPSGDHNTEAYQVLLKLAVLQHGVRSREVVDVLHRMDGEQHGTRSMFEITLLRLYGQKFVYPEAGYWYALDGSPAASPGGGALDQRSGPMPVPVPPGMVTLVWSPNWTEDHVCPLKSSGNGEYCYPDWSKLRRLVAKYGPDGLQLVVLANTRGFVAGAGGVPPEQEAPAIRQFYQEQLGFRAIVAVDTTPYQYTAAPDGRRINGCTAWQKRYLLVGDCTPGIGGPKFNPPDLWLLDRDGRIRLVGGTPMPDSNNMTTEDPVLELFVQQVLREH